MENKWSQLHNNNSNRQQQQHITLDGTTLHTLIKLRFLWSFWNGMQWIPCLVDLGEDRSCSHRRGTSVTITSNKTLCFYHHRHRRRITSSYSFAFFVWRRHHSIYQVRYTTCNMHGLSHTFQLPFRVIQSIRNTFSVVWTCGYCTTAIQGDFLFTVLVCGHRGCCETIGWRARQWSQMG